MVTINVKEMVGANAISMNSGQKIKSEINKLWEKEDTISVNFEGIDVFASPFFNASIGALLKDKTIEQLQGKLKFINISDHGRRLLNLVIQNAIKFYSDSSDNTKNGLDQAHKDM
ncbi:STAS-like domain-containing protein [Halopseudomonas pelagia]|uniref:DUF4325 domain-containing protein n=1 Tax=Halopseudomonas pelagia TaxID=553151 RepID=A0AA91U1L2_9GAMM|nr:STAS-like domain-containing protein [Halopseudomonas pelagia]PCC98990.1 hypothetical protein CO192_12600 [Halopseudomonas pelagia]QFY55417.1 DUF4325 domain-containing protein [Halopseudomonas pelagia]